MAQQNTTANTTTHHLFKKFGIAGILIIFLIFFYQSVKNQDSVSKSNIPQSDNMSKINNEIMNIKNKIEELTYTKEDESLISPSTLAGYNSKKEISELKKQLDEISNKLSGISISDLENNTTNTEFKPLDQGEQDQKQELHNISIANLYTNTIAIEQPDPQWSVSTEEKARASLSSISDKIEMQSIECKTTLCRIEISKQDSTTDDEAIEAFDSNINWPGAMSMTYDPKSGSAVVYMARDGYPLPQLEN